MDNAILIISERRRRRVYKYPDVLARGDCPRCEVERGNYSRIYIQSGKKMGKRPRHIGTGKVRSLLTVIRFRGTQAMYLIYTHLYSIHRVHI